MATILQIGPVSTTLLLSGGAAVGLLLWLVGRGLARPATAVGGLLAATAGAAILVGTWPSMGMRLCVIGVSAAVGALVAYLLFRIWMALAIAVVLGAAVPLATLAWSGTAPPPAPWSLGGESEDAEAEPEPPKAAEAAVPGPRWPAWVSQLEPPPAAADLGRRQWTALCDWWEELGPGGRRHATLVAAGAALVGLLGGLAVPSLAASIPSALIGGALLLGCALALVRRQGWAESIGLPQGARPLVVALGLITVAGVGVQWIIFRRRADT